MSMAVRMLVRFIFPSIIPWTFSIVNFWTSGKHESPEVRLHSVFCVYQQITTTLPPSGSILRQMTSLIPRHWMTSTSIVMDEQLTNKNWLMKIVLLPPHLFPKNLICLENWYGAFHECQYWNSCSMCESRILNDQIDKFMWHFLFDHSFSKLLCCLQFMLV